MSLSLKAESWTWYAFVVLLVAFRFASRIIHLGSVKKLQVEDWIMLFVVCIFTVLVACMNIVAKLDTNLIAPEDIPNLTHESIKSRIYGSKLVLLVEQCMITTQWGCKICLLLLYNKLTFGLKQQWAVKIVGAYVVVTYVVMEILYFGVWCRPIQGYWQVPVENIQCSAAINHLITNAVFNMSSDLMMMAIPLPLLITSRLPPLKKVMLCGLFGLGIFVILCATLNKYYSFNDPFSPQWTFWYIREASCALLVANIPNCWPLIRRIFNLRSFSGTSDNPSHIINARNGAMSVSQGHQFSGHQHHPSVPVGSQDDLSIFNGRGFARSESREAINTKSSGSGNDVPLEIWQDVEVRVDGAQGDDRSRERRKERRVLDLEAGQHHGFGFQNKTTVTAFGR